MSHPDARTQAIIHGLESRPPARDDDIDEFERGSGLQLPKEYRSFLRTTNGAEGFVGENAYVMLWPLEELLELNQAYEVAKYAPGLFLFGSNGGGEAYAFDMRHQAPTVVQVPFVGMDLDLAQPIASDFDSFLKRLWRS